MPNKIKSVSWRACKNILPTKVNLCDRRIIHDPTCETNDFATKTRELILSECDKADEILKLSGILLDTRAVRFLEFEDILWHAN